MQIVNLQYNVPRGYTLEEFVAKVNSYVARLTNQQEITDFGYEPNEATKASFQEAKHHLNAYKKGEEWTKNNPIDTTSVESMLKSCGI